MRLLAITMLLAGCGDALPLASFIDKLRVLAVQAEPPEIAPGERTTLAALAVQPPIPSLMLDAGVIVEPRYLWLACTQPEGVTVPTPCGVSENTIPPLCSDNPSATLCIIGEGREVRYTAPPGALAPDATTQKQLTVVVADTPGGPAQCLLDIQANHGRPAYPDRCVVSLKRLVISGKPTRNQNPRLAALFLAEKDQAGQLLTVGDAQFEIAPDGDHRPTLKLGMVRRDDAAEKKTADEYEALSVAFFSTAGKIEGNRGVFDPPGCSSQEDCAKKLPIADVSTVWRSPTQAELEKTSDPERRVFFWAVLRDDRGGVDWLAGSARPR